MSGVWPVILVVVCALLVCCFLWPRKAPLPKQKPPFSDDAIFVIAPRGCDTHQIFATADVPERVFFGLGVPQEFQTNTRCLHNLSDAAFGNSIVREHIAQQLYRGEKFILCLGPGVTHMLSHWDTILRQTVNRHGERTAIVSQWPVEGGERTFPVCYTFAKDLPVFVPRVCFANPKAFEIGLATWDCVFAAAATLLPFVSPTLPLVSPQEDDLLFSFELFNASQTVLTPASSIVAGKLSSQVNQVLPALTPTISEARKLTWRVVKHLLHGAARVSPKIDGCAYLVGRTRPFSANQFFTWLGCEKTRPCGRAQLGLLSGFSVEDVLSRYASVAEFEVLQDNLYRHKR